MAGTLNVQFMFIHELTLNCGTQTPLGLGEEVSISSVALASVVCHIWKLSVFKITFGSLFDHNSKASMTQYARIRTMFWAVLLKGGHI